MSCRQLVGFLSLVGAMALGGSGCLYQAAAPVSENGGQDAEESMDATDVADVADDVADMGRDVRDVREDTGDGGDAADVADASDTMDAPEDVEPDVTPENEQNCSDNVDGDRDGLTDCADTDCMQANRCGRIIFGIREFSNGQFANDASQAFQAANDACRSAAAQVSGLDDSVGWTAIVGNRSDSVKDRVGDDDEAVFNLNSRAVVGSNSSLFDEESLNAPITDVSGNTFGSSVRMWTGSRDDGNSPSDDGTSCADWTATESEDLFDFELEGIVGVPSSLSNWLTAASNNRLRACTESHGIYCISN